MFANQIYKTSQLFSNPKNVNYFEIIQTYFQDMDEMGKSQKKEEFVFEIMKQLEMKTMSRYWNIDIIIQSYNNKISSGKIHESMKEYIPEGLFSRIEERKATNDDILFISNNNPYSEIPLTIGMFTLADMITEAHKKLGINEVSKNEDFTSNLDSSIKQSERISLAESYHEDIRRDFGRGKTKPNLQEIEERIFKQKEYKNGTRK